MYFLIDLVLIKGTAGKQSRKEETKTQDRDLKNQDLKNQEFKTLAPRKPQIRKSGPQNWNLKNAYVIWVEKQ